MKVTLASCGKFHYGNFVDLLAKRDCLEQYIFAHKRSTFQGQSWADNLWAKEYVMYGLFALGLDKLSDRWMPWLHAWWDFRASRVLSPHCNVLHVMLHGTSLRLIRRAKANGALIVGEAVNAHPAVYHEVNKTQHEALGLRYPDKLNGQTSKILEEITCCDFLLCPSEWVRSSYVARGFDRNKSTVIPYGVNLEAFTPPTDWSHRELPHMEVLCACQIIPRKGIHILLAAWRGISHNLDARLTIAGRCPSAYGAILADLPDKCAHVGSKDRGGLVTLMQTASVFVLPTLEDGFAVVVLEAMATGCVVITTSAAGAAEIIENGVDGFVISPGDSDALAEKLAWLQANASSRAQMGRAAAQKARSLAGWVGYADELTAFYNKLV